MLIIIINNISINNIKIIFFLNILKINFFNKKLFLILNLINRLINKINSIIMNLFIINFNLKKKFIIKINKINIRLEI